MQEQPAPSAHHMGSAARMWQCVATRHMNRHTHACTHKQVNGAQSHRSGTPHCRCEPPGCSRADATGTADSNRQHGAFVVHHSCSTENVLRQQPHTLCTPPPPPHTQSHELQPLQQCGGLPPDACVRHTSPPLRSFLKSTHTHATGLVRDTPCWWQPAPFSALAACPPPQMGPLTGSHILKGWVDRVQGQ